MNTTTSKPIAKGAQMGERTNHHDQAMMFVSLRTMKTMQSRPRKPMPPLWELFFAIVFYLLKIKGEVSATPTAIGGLHVSHTSPGDT
jgi:hypothetical protein